ncbi:MAG: hypothetical protein Q8R37_03160 [Nanoarchaeota archaeon]|nr:hypothetical protein [Nanoarchaeota archaeon]
MDNQSMDISLMDNHKKHRCDYCHQDLSAKEWKSHWEEHIHHYKITDCSCGKEKWLKVTFAGSGHDDFVAGVSPLESTLRKVHEN